jgi:hypothetical protein
VQVEEEDANLGGYRASCVFIIGRIRVGRATALSDQSISSLIRNNAFRKLPAT